MNQNEKVAGQKRQIVHTVFEKTKISQCGSVKKKCKKKNDVFVSLSISDLKKISWYILRRKRCHYFFCVIFGVASFVLPISIRHILKNTKNCDAHA